MDIQLKLQQEFELKQTQVENVIDTDQDTKEGREEQERKQKRQQNKINKR